MELTDDIYFGGEPTAEEWQAYSDWWESLKALRPEGDDE